MNGSVSIVLCIAADLRFAAYKLTSRRHLFIHQWKKFRRWQDFERDNAIYREEKYRIQNAIRLSDDIYLAPEKPEDLAPKKAVEDMTRRETGAIPLEFYTNHTQMRYVDHSWDNVRRVREYNHLQHLQYDQRFISERTMFLGADLAAAHFLIFRGGAVKFIGKDEWYRAKYTMLHTKMPPIPNRKEPGYYVEGLDASNTELMYEGFDNFYDLEYCRLLSLANCNRINDWALSRLGNVFGKSLEFLDLSNCKRISAKGLLGLRSLTNLRYLRLEGLDDNKDIAKSAIMLEEALPELTVVGLNYDVALERLKDEQKLLSDDRVLIDAKGNAFVEDDNGRLFYVYGNVNERACVCDDDKPLITSTIRREIPAIEEAEFDRLDQLSHGKLRHYLLGSPSGYSWTEQVETILSFQEKWNRWDAIPTNPRMLPKEMRMKRLGDGKSAEPLIGESEEKKRLEGDKVEAVAGEPSKHLLNHV